MDRQEPVGEMLEVLRRGVARELVDEGLAGIRGPHEVQPGRSDVGHGLEPDGLLHVRTVTPLFARLITSDSRSRTPTSTATSLSWIAARMAGRSGVTGTRIRSAIAKTARLTSQ